MSLFGPSQFKPAVMPMFSYSDPRAVKLRHKTKTGGQGADCKACGQRIPPHAEHECWTLEAIPEREAAAGDAP